ncbi:unnamed protein product [Mytilus coruscus]|uniref:SGNH hydrolase-type esterase domain-containing protein n=1 Tax=Mytilus coruscus TaxID=42192 RepID=A0A6J8B0I7_MYTCO|nr:unnamed protein product [Mytilus coruscus]
MVHRVLIFGHSFVHRLESFLYENRAEGRYNLGFDGTKIQVEFAGLGGSTLRPGRKSIQKAEFMHVFHTFKPDSVLIQIGGNDLTSERKPEKLARDIASFCDYIITVYGVSHVIVGQLLPRPKQRTRSKRRAAPSDLTERDLVIDPEVLTETTNQRGRKRVRNNGPSTTTAPVMNSAGTTAQPTADEIAAAMITQLRGAGLHLADSSGVRISDDRLSSVCGILSSATQEVVSSTDYKTERQNTLPSSSTNAVHCSLVPPVTSDKSVAGYFTANSPTTQEDQSLGIDSSVIGQTGNYLLRNTLPLMFFLDRKQLKFLLTLNQSSY